MIMSINLPEISPMAISEERLQLLLPRRLKRAVQERARNLGLSVGEHIRRLIETDLDAAGQRGAGVNLPFGDQPIHTGRTRGSVDHDRMT